MTTVKEEVLAALKVGPVKRQDCQKFRIGPTTLKSAIWELRRDGHVIEACRQEDDTLGRNVYTLVEP